MKPYLAETFLNMKTLILLSAFIVTVASAQLQNGMTPYMQALNATNTSALVGSGDVTTAQLNFASNVLWLAKEAGTNTARLVAQLAGTYDAAGAAQNATNTARLIAQLAGNYDAAGSAQNATNTARLLAQLAGNYDPAGTAANATNSARLAFQLGGFFDAINAAANATNRASLSNVLRLSFADISVTGSPGGSATNAWGLNGNASVGSTNFIGTTINVPLTMKVFNQPVASFSYGGAGGYAIVIGGNAYASGNNAVSIGDAVNTASGDNSMALGYGNMSAAGGYTFGSGNSASSSGAFAIGLGNVSSAGSGSASFALGEYAYATNISSFVWADHEAVPSGFGSKTNNQFLVRVQNGFGINTNVTGTNALTVRGSTYVDGTGTFKRWLVATNFYGDGSGLSNVVATGSIAITAGSGTNNYFKSPTADSGTFTGSNYWATLSVGGLSTPYTNASFETDGNGTVRPATNGFFLATNALSAWPTAPRTRGEAYFGNSNGVVYLLTSTPAALTWAATNKIAP